MSFSGNRPFLIGVVWFLFRFVSLISSQPDPKDTPTLHCPNPNQFIFLHTADSYSIVAHHVDHPPSTRYTWEIIDSTCPSCFFDEYTTPSSLFITTGRRQRQAAEINVVLVIEATIRDWLFRARAFSKSCALNIKIQKPVTLGIDLGTTYSCITQQFADMDERTHRRLSRVFISDHWRNEHCIPSAVYFPPMRADGSDSYPPVIVGFSALSKLNISEAHSKNVFYDIKRILGRHKNDTEVKEFKQNHLFQMTDDDYPKLIITNRNHSEILPEQISAIILAHLVSIASQELQIPYQFLTNVVVSIPAFFHSAQRKAVYKACEIAGLQPSRLVVEPTAAAVAHIYYHGSADTNYAQFITFDFGGGTLDCSLMSCSGIGCNVLAVEGDSALGGIDFDHVIKDIVIEKLETEHGLKREDISNTLYNNIVKISEKIKKSLSVNTVHWDRLRDQTMSYRIKITQQEFENHPQTQQIIQRAIDTVLRVIPGEAENIRSVVLVGGSVKMPFVERRIRAVFDNGRTRIEIAEKPQLMVAIGSAVIAGGVNCLESVIYGGVDDEESECAAFGVYDVVPLSLGFEICDLPAPTNADADADGNRVSDEEGVIEIAYVIDATYSMHDWIAQVKDDIRGLMTAIQAKYPRFTFRLAVIGYRDYEDAKPMEVLEFTSTVSEFDAFLTNLHDEGGGDVPENVMGGLMRATSLDWQDSSTARMVIHIFDAPHHGRVYHDFDDAMDNHLDIVQVEAVDHTHILHKFKDLEITFVMTKLNDWTGKMIGVFKDYGAVLHFPVIEKPLKETHELLEVSTKVIIGEIAGRIKTPGLDGYAGALECGVLGVVIRKNEFYPTVNRTQYRCMNGSDTEIHLNVFEGDSRYVAENFFISSIVISDIPRGLCASNAIDVEFAIDENGICTITASIQQSDGTPFGTETQRLSVYAKDADISSSDKRQLTQDLLLWFNNNENVRTGLRYFINNLVVEGDGDGDGDVLVDVDVGDTDDSGSAEAEGNVLKMKIRTNEEL